MSFFSKKTKEMCLDHYVFDKSKYGWCGSITCPARIVCIVDTEKMDEYQQLQRIKKIEEIGSKGVE